MTTKYHAFCPVCDNNAQTLGIIQNGLVKFYCDDCNQKFKIPVDLAMSNDVLEWAKRTDISRLKCKYCGSKNYKKSGHDKYGKQRIECKSCGKRFVTNKVIFSTLRNRPKCPKCGGRNCRNGSASYRKADNKVVLSFQCKKCMISFVPKADLLYKKNPICKWCNHDYVIKSGRRRGKQRYYCKECRRTFLLPISE